MDSLVIEHTHIDERVVAFANVLGGSSGGTDWSRTSSETMRAATSTSARKSSISSALLAIVLQKDKGEKKEE